MIRSHPERGLGGIAALKTQTGLYGFVERTRCPACLSSTWETVYRCAFAEPPISVFIEQHYRICTDVLGNAQYELARCGDCELLYQRWIGDTDLLLELYGVWVNDFVAPDTDPTYQSELTHFRQSRDAHEIMVAASFVGVPLSSFRTLDYGMGWGLWARIAKLVGCESFGTDLSPARMEYARRYGIYAITEDEIRGEKFDFINTEQVMEHLSEPLQVGRRLASALAPGGVLKVSVPSAERARANVPRLKAGSARSVAEDLASVEPLEHVNGFTRKSITHFAKTLGLQIVRPPLVQAYAFLGQPATISVARPFKAAKELIRPIYQFHNPRNLYVWMRKS